MRQAVIYLGKDGCWVAECPTLPGCISQGKTREEAIQNIREAIEGYIAVLEEDGLPVPKELMELRQHQEHPTIAELLAELNEIQKREPVEFEIPARTEF